MKVISQSLASIINLNNVCIHHKEYCNQSDCGVSLFQLKMLALKLLETVQVHEREEANLIIARWPD